MNLKTIFHIGPRNTTDWHPIWKECYKSWQEIHLKDSVELKLYNDEQDLMNIVKRYEPSYLPFFLKLPFNVSRVDFSRLILLYYEGGMYSDLDVYCYKTFYSNINCDVMNLLQAGPETGFAVQPTIMACEPGNIFVKQYIKNILQIFESGKLFVEMVDISRGKDKTNFLFNSTGVGVCNLTYKSFTGVVNQLDYKEYNCSNTFFEGIKTQHLRTGVFR